MGHIVRPWLACLLLITPAAAQDSDRLELKAVFGTVGFLDEVTDYHPVVGGGARVRLSRAVSVEPEVLYGSSSGNQLYAFQAALTREFWPATAFRPYLVAGAGVLHRRFRFPGARRERFSSSEFTGGGGLGVRIRAGDRFWLSPELRFGWEPLVRATVGLGYVLD